MFLWFELVIMLGIILVAAQLFSNALEYLGEKLAISSGVTGSIFAAISTALPETTIPVLAIIAGTSNQLVNEEISVGAILGAPLMLSTLSTFIMAISIIQQRGIHGRIKPEKSGFVRDLNFFLLAFIFAAVAMYVPFEHHYIRYGLSLMLIALYITYVILTFRASKKLVMQGHAVEPSEPLIFTKLGLQNNTVTIVLQLVLGLLLLLFGARQFIHAISAVSQLLNISALLISLLIIPIATELPEKVNSVLWVRKNKDTLAFGNITGAMVFQGSLLPAIGVLLTPWQPSQTVLTGLIMTFIAGLWLRINASERGIPILVLLLNGLFYLIYLFIVFK